MDMNDTNATLTASPRGGSARRRMDVWAALLVTAAIASATFASAADDSRPTEAACIAYAEADAAFEAAKKEAVDAYEAAYRKAKAVYEGAEETLAAWHAARNEAMAVREAAITEAHAVLMGACYEIYGNDGGRLSDVESVTVKLINADRKRCRRLYGI